MSISKYIKCPECQGRCVLPMSIEEDNPYSIKKTPGQIILVQCHTCMGYGLIKETESIDDGDIDLIGPYYISSEMFNLTSEDIESLKLALNSLDEIHEYAEVACGEWSINKKYPGEILIYKNGEFMMNYHHSNFSPAIDSQINNLLRKAISW